MELILIANGGWMTKQLLCLYDARSACLKKQIFLNKLKKIFKSISDAPALSSLLKNAYRSLPCSQLELAKYYLFETEEIIEAYAWADVAYCRNIRGSHEIKRQAQELLKPEETKEAWDLARDYKQNFIPKLQTAVANTKAENFQNRIKELEQQLKDKRK